MNVINFPIACQQTASFSVMEDHHPCLYPHLHRHPEVQITWIRSGKGDLLVDDYIGSFKQGDVFVIGPGQPHVFRGQESDVDPGAIAVSLFFNERALGDHFLDLPEMRMVKIFLENCNGGFMISGAAKEHIARELEQLLQATNVQRMISFLTILKWVSELKDRKVLSKPFFQKPINAYDNTRINLIIDFTKKNSASDITLPQVAKIAGMVPESFCKYFKSRTHKTYFQFLNELRVHNACKLLMKGGPTIATVSHMVGFNSLSNFNRMFKKIIGITPLAYVYQSVGLQTGQLP